MNENTSDPLYQHSGTSGAHANHTLTISVANNMFDCTPLVLADLPLGALYENFLDHGERTSKDGLALIGGAATHGRKDQGVASMSCLIYDTDGGLSCDEVDERVSRAGLEAVVWTTHNHGRRKSFIRRTKADRWAEEHGYRTGTEEAVIAFCKETPKHKHLTAVRLLDGGAKSRVAEEVEAYGVNHDPEVRTRILFPLKTTIPVQELKEDGYKAVYHGVGSLHFDDTYDPSCANPSRLNFLPTHPPGAAEYWVSHYSGVLLDWVPIYEQVKSEVEQQRARRNARHKEWNDAPPRALADLHHVLDGLRSDIPRPDWFRAVAGIYHETRASEAGRQLAHAWSERDYDEYDYDEVENIWNGFSDDREKPATMGSLIQLARKYGRYASRARLNRNMR